MQRVNEELRKLTRKQRRLDARIDDLAKASQDGLLFRNPSITERQLTG